MAASPRRRTLRRRSACRTRDRDLDADAVAPNIVGVLSRTTGVTETPSNATRVDVLIGGGGFAGLSLAIALRQALGQKFAVTVADPVA